MPSNFRRKIYISNRYYHIFNRGINKENIFHRQKDYIFYKTCLKEYLSPRRDLIHEYSNRHYREDFLKKKLYYLHSLKSFNNRIRLISYCLMPNHIHLLIWQDQERDISKFMQSLHTRYGKYYKKTYKSYGPLFQDRFKARLIYSDSDLLETSRYIHRNPLDIGINIYKYRWSSIGHYNSKIPSLWISKKKIEEIFTKNIAKTTNRSYYRWLEDGPSV